MNKAAIFHIIMFGVAWRTFIVALILGRKEKKEHNHLSEWWKFFVAGLFFIALSEIVDLYMPFAKEPTGGINIYSEVTEFFGLSLLFLGIIDFLRKRLKEP